MFYKLNRLLQTVRYLKARQIRGQLRHRLRRAIGRYNNGRKHAPTTYPGCAWPQGVCFLAPGAQENRADAIRGGTLGFLNRQESVGFPPNWDCPELPKLWQYNLHYFEWLWALGYEDAKTAALDWIERHPLAKDAVGWEPYPTSLRLMNFCAVFFGKFREQTEADATFLQKLWASLVNQSKWLACHLETHLLGNHYLENGAALAFVGSCFEGQQAASWFETGCRILREEIREQVLPDGTHFELSPMYHCRVLYLLSMLMATGNEQLRAIATEPLGRMSKTLACLCHPDGGIALLNDSAFGIYNEPEQLQSFCKDLPGVNSSPPGNGCFALPDAGYYGWRDREGNYLVCDFGKIGPDYLPGHAHADIFSFELSLRGHRVIVDSGVHDYEVSDTRRYCRSTAAHNTVEIDGQDQCEMWGAFRVARRGYPKEVVWQPSASGFSISGSHTGYRRLAAKPIHNRIIKWDAGTGLEVTDRITASRPVKAVSRLHLHPHCSIRGADSQGVTLATSAGRVRITFPEGQDFRIEDSLYLPRFGVRQENKAVALLGSGANVVISCRVERAE